VIDPFIAGVGIGLVASPVAGRAIELAIERLPAGRRRAAEWTVVVGALGIALVAQFARGPAARILTAFLVAALPGTLTYLASKTLLASTLVTLAPLYFAIASFNAGRAVHMPATWVDRAVPLAPAWVFVYASLSVAILLPLLVVRDRSLMRRALAAYLLVWIAGLAGFLLYPTVGPRPAVVSGDGFAAWCLRLTYTLDTRFNCFPSLHVAQTLVAALTAHRVNRWVGRFAVLWSTLIGASTLFTKQHYFVDVAAGAGLAILAWHLFLRGYPREAVTDVDRSRAPRRAFAGLAFYSSAVGLLWIAHSLGVTR
jgi:membrane-associated phospholipid phosphatase